MDALAAEVDRVVFTPYPTQLKVGETVTDVCRNTDYYSSSLL